ncbi:hypothetical protein SAMN02745172_02460 [Pseudoxanthobacter soli DSM 19599]|uniref:SWIM-type domain-containing protein n=1 Tax=Pseudoxanthobacter soli DSM 19599 TaxID=1123029 RepID=A0A1M7ZLN4_9HYPH|nr:hypothetical protein [Pseudoxanthobacter soli]SHO65813.1 hypothetical protein SAMN02745172_02460 [Pseudoxanthobacter soli DSM 19599]
MLRYRVRSDSTGEIYEITAQATQAGIRFACTCAGAASGLHCKHRLRLAAGNTKGLVDGDDVAALQDLIRGSVIAAVIDEIDRLDAEAARMKAATADAKRRLARAMMG